MILMIWLFAQVHIEPKRATMTVTTTCHCQRLLPRSSLSNRDKRALLPRPPLKNLPTADLDSNAAFSRACLSFIEIENFEHTADRDGCDNDSANSSLMSDGGAQDGLDEDDEKENQKSGDQKITADSCLRERTVSTHRQFYASATRTSSSCPPRTSSAKSQSSEQWSSTIELTTSTNDSQSQSGLGKSSCKCPAAQWSFGASHSWNVKNLSNRNSALSKIKHPSSIVILSVFVAQFGHCLVDADLKDHVLDLLTLLGLS